MSSGYLYTKGNENLLFKQQELTYRGKLLLFIFTPPAPGRRGVEDSTDIEYT